MFFPAGHSFGDLSLVSDTETSRGSHKRLTCQCKCGRITEKEACALITGHTITCNKCNFLPAEYWEKTKFGKLRMKFPKETFGGTRAKNWWLCDCGKETFTQTLGVFRGGTTSCGKCELLTAQHFAETKYGKLRMKFPQDMMPGSHKEVLWVCDCGNETSRPPGLITTRHTESCGKCNFKSKEFWEQTKFGKLKRSDPKYGAFKSNEKAYYDCDCGNKRLHNPCDVSSGKIRSCGRCWESAQKWYRTHESILRSLKTPILQQDIPMGWIKLLEPIRRVEAPTRMECFICNSEYTPRWGNIRQGKSLTCGCSSNQVSKAAIEILEHIKSLGIEAESEYKMAGASYDIAIPSHRLVIEHNGLRFHQGEKFRTRDYAKFLRTIKEGWSQISIFEDEWMKNPDKVKSLIFNRLGLGKSQSLRPLECEIRKISGDEANSLYDDHHYIGKVKASVHYGVSFEGRLIGAVSFGQPTRQTSKHPWELLRMVGHPEFRVHGIWSKILKQFCREYSPKSIVSFSDNRLFSGGVYERIGFKFDGNVRPDYYWVKGSKRHHKSGLRKKASEDQSKTEIQLREAQGYFRMYDLGKKRWVMIP